MKDPSLLAPSAERLDEVLPATLEEAEQLAANVERAVSRSTGGAVRNLAVEVNDHGILLKGHCSTYYCKQLAQQAVMSLAGAGHVTNSIEVT